MGTLLVCAVTVAGTAHAVDVGVLAGSGGCPSTFDSYYIYIDNEDGNNANDRSGWLGASVSMENTKLNFCRVNGDQLASVGANEPYMVLRLETECPAGTARHLRRHVDAENTLDGPESSSNVPGALVPGTVGNAPDVNLNFCVFPDTNTSIPFPDFGIEYGVFASPTFNPALHLGVLYMDDQDSNNSDYWCDVASGPIESACSYYSADKNYWNIIMGGRNTSMRLANVRVAPPEGCSAAPGGLLPLVPAGLSLLVLASRRRLP